MRAIRWYLKGLFPPTFTISFYVIVVVLEYLLYYGSGRISSVMGILVFFINPIFVISGFLHVSRSREITLFELSMLASWRDVALAKVLSAFIYIIPFAVIQSTFILAEHGSSQYALTEVMFLLSYTSLGLLVSLIGSKSSGLAVAVTAFFIMPISVQILIINYIHYKMKVDQFISSVGYILNPITTYCYHVQGIVTLGLMKGLIINIIADAIFLLLFYIAFRSIQIKP
jgi:hypothetical protein